MNKLYLSKSILGEEAMVEMGKYDYTFNCCVNKACCCLIRCMIWKRFQFPI